MYRPPFIGALSRTRGALLLAASLASASISSGAPAPAPAPPAREATAEIRLAVTRTGGAREKLRPGDEKRLEEVIRKRLPILAAEGATLDYRSLDDLRIRVPAAQVTPSQLRMLTRVGRLEFRHLEDIQTSLNPRGDYMIDVLNIQGAQSESTFRFRDRRTNRPIPATDFLRRCPLLASNEDLFPGSASKISSGVLLAVRVQFTDPASRRLDRFMSKPGRMLATVLDGEMVGINAVQQRVKRGKRQKGEDEQIAGVDITGGYATELEADHLAVVLNSGALPAALSVVSTRVLTEEQRRGG
ncbi:MAG TPA: hypothetical protein VK689_05615 [Armatimonadota bacterium]|nr:hypothetical protein [Armatimonadota bacterium]